MFTTSFASTDVANTAQSMQSSFLSFLPIIVLIAVFYFLIIRPQQKKAKEENKMRESLRIGDKIVISSGIFGSVVAIDDKKGVLSLEIAKGVSIMVYKSSIVEVLFAKDSLKNETKP